MELVINKTYLDTQYGDVKLLSHSDTHCKVELLKDKEVFVYDSELGCHKEVVLYPKGQVLEIECCPRYQEIALMSTEELSWSH